MTGTYPRIFDNPARGAEARRLFDDAQGLLDRIVREKLLTARAVFGFFPASAVGDDVELYTDESRTGLLGTLHTLRQQNEKPEGQANQALADFIAPRESGVADYLGAFAVTTGIGIEGLLDEFGRDHDDYSAIMTKALADRLAEALAEALHKKAREEWGYGRDEGLSNDELIRERYRGIRPAPGYPACPDHSEKRLLFDLLQAERRAGIRLTETFAMFPAAAVSGFYFSHPEARYFTVGRLDRDQVLDYARRKGLPLADVERWLSPNLNYEPDEKSSTETPAAPVVAEKV
jgi:5-methyltetrahydrofolate--homocysteine methyltransferase